MRVTRLPCFLLAAAGCLSAPTGRDPSTIDAGIDGGIDAAENSWPPNQANIIAIGAGDLDVDNVDDIIAADQATGRIYFLQGGAGNDLDPTRADVLSATASAPLAGLRAPAAVIVARNGTDRFVVVLDNPAAGPRLTVFDDALTMVSQTNAGNMPAATGAAVTLSQTAFGVNMNAVFGSIPDAVFFLEGGALATASPNLMQLPETGGTPFASVLAVSGFIVTGTPTLVVSELDHAQKATSSGPGVFSWTTVRAVGPTWTSQAVADINIDGRGDVVAFAPEGGNPADICVLDGSAGTSACLDTPFGMDTGTIAVGPVVATAQNDVIIAHVNPSQPTMTALFVVPRLRNTGTLMSDMISNPTMFVVADPMMALAQLDGSTTGKEVVVMGKNGTVVCARTSGTAFVRCNL